ncbi:hypothetical protein SAMN02910456_01494 [Ruminococcaceae bacterium YRB3002]|nr:hypothetical protein SAMN02910456_01494 [Ruminococcaceae bacterium YRB3002]
MDREDREMSLDDLSQVSGGYVFDGDGADMSIMWLNGYDVMCPLCGAGKKSEFVLQGAIDTDSNPGAVFLCKGCRTKFVFKKGPGGRIVCGEM